MLGKGRPFILEIFNPKISVGLKNDANFLKNAENQINENHMVAVRDL